MPTQSQIQASNVTALLKARNCTLWCVTSEEARVEAHLAQAAAAAGYMPFFWDCAAGPTDLAGNSVRIPDPSGDNGRGADTVLAHIASVARTGTQQGLWVLRDMAPWLNDPRTLRQLRNLARALPPAPMPQAVVILTPSSEIPPELANHATMITWPRPDRPELAGIIDSLAKLYNLKFENGTRDASIEAAVGLTGEEAESCYARSLVTLKRIDPALVASEKKSIIAKSKTLQWMEPLPGGFDAIGGLDVIKQWTLSRIGAYTPRARAYGIQAMKGIGLVGVSGCGKTYVSKAIAKVLGDWPLLRWDPNAGKSKFMGESEANFRRGIEIIESTGRCVVLIDEVEKCFAGASGGAGGAADGGVAADAMGAFLTWAQERKSEAFLICTSNDVTALPPEFLRRGRWDELFWVDLPTARERKAILRAAMKSYGRDEATIAGIDLAAVATVTGGFSGAELASLIPDAMHVAFADNERMISTDDLMIAASTVTPLSVTAKEKIDAMRAWSRGRARLATTPEADEPVVQSGRRLDLTGLTIAQRELP